MLRNIYQKLASLTFGIWLIAGVMLLLGAGSFSSGAAESGSINDLPLFVWLREAPLAASWWLWGSLALLALLALNTILCSIESLRSKWGKTGFLILIAPQVMHIGFLLIILAHLLSAGGSYKQIMQVEEGSVIGFPDGSLVGVTAIRGSVGQMGMLTDFSADLALTVEGRQLYKTARPNEPVFYQGVGLYVKDVAIMPRRAALIEVHREPGAGIALAGALLFTLGNVVLLAVRRGR
ncbi:cytochrome C biogenesis protein ResB [Geobacter sp. DSM 9736]|uniref:cytochrome C biogenesis protein ResB n=1 Tax=Geobacter sp. DSM 9736 TaxID=1277350 RepID=UPI000B50CAFE|nr:cytochrome C biogenesis protein ResB [Geobacter sp. DSM 9736]SNB47544.1 hypothetical protein SAMN06269301_3034 [Geobacter sp. DSM 9736]